MTTSKDSGARLQTATQEGRDARLLRRSHLASVGLVLVLLGVSAFSVWSSQITSAASADALAATRVSDDFERAASAVAEEESLERKYRLGPSRAVRNRFTRTSDALLTALGEVRRDGDASDRALVDQLLLQHDVYLDAVERLFTATDQADSVLAAQIDAIDVDPTLSAIQSAVLAGARDRQTVSKQQLQRLHRLETLVSRLTPLVFLVGLVMAALLARAARAHRRLLDIERTRAVHDSMHDSLTGLPNRTLLAEQCLQALLADQSRGTRSGLLLFDLDRFKEVNDTFGHQCGDELLTQIGPRLAGVLGDGDTVARLGGDEFAVLLTDVRNEQGAHAVAVKLRAALDAPFHIAGVDLDVEASVGLVVSGEHGRDASTLLRHADIAMYAAKARNCGVFAYDPKIDGHTPAKLALLGDLRRALERDELILHYQPKISLTTGDVVGVEALVRWQHAERGMVFPNDFIPLAEHTGLIAPLTRHVVNVALAQARVWMDAGQPLKVSVNLSARNLLDTRLPDEIAAMLAAHGVPAELLELEVTESALMTEPARAQGLLESLSALGIKISIDDFGAGYTSLGQLRTLPLSELKIDGSFVASMATDRGSALIVQSVIDLGHNLGLTIVAEGIETGQTMEALAAFGCDVAQGYFVSRPISADAIDTWRVQRRIAAVKTNRGTLPTGPIPVSNAAV